MTASALLKLLVLTNSVLLRSSGKTQGASADGSLSITPSAEDLKAELLAHSRKPPQRSGLPSIRTGRLAQRSASDAVTSLPFSPAQPEPQALMAFPPSVSCPPEFWGEVLAEISVAWCSGWLMSTIQTDRLLHGNELALDISRASRVQHRLLSSHRLQQSF